MRPSDSVTVFLDKSGVQLKCFNFLCVYTNLISEEGMFMRCRFSCSLTASTVLPLSKQQAYPRVLIINLTGDFVLVPAHISATTWISGSYQCNSTRGGVCICWKSPQSIVRSPCFGQGVGPIRDLSR